MKIAILTSGILPVPAVKGGAVENLTDFYLEYNDRHGVHDITVFSIADPETAKHPALRSRVNKYVYIDTRSFWAKLRKRLWHLLGKDGYYHYSITYFLHQALKRLTREHFDLIILENRPGFALSLPAQKGTAVIYHLHNDFLNVQTNEADRLYQRADGIITVSDYITERVRTICPEDKKTYTVYNGIDIEAFEHTEKAVERARMGISEGDVVLVYWGRLIREKGIMEVVEAMLKLKEMGFAPVLLVIGSSFYGNSTHDDDFIEELKGKAASLQRQIVFTGYVPYTQLPAYLMMADIAVVPSMWEEPFGLTALEALAAGLPLVTTRSGGIPEVCEGVAKVLEREDIAQRIAEAVKDYYQQPEAWRLMGEAGRKRAREFSKERYTRELFETIRDILKVN